MMEVPCMPSSLDKFQLDAATVLYKRQMFCSITSGSIQDPTLAWLQIECIKKDGGDEPLQAWLRPKA
eukprot:scaffold75924_cov20-Tisochrysis_lutea.AAC.1